MFRAQFATAYTACLAHSRETAIPSFASSIQLLQNSTAFARSRNSDFTPGYAIKKKEFLRRIPMIVFVFEFCTLLVFPRVFPRGGKCRFA